jgi:cephalosporin hydroxylase
MRCESCRVVGSVLRGGWRAAWERATAMLAGRSTARLHDADGNPIHDRLSPRGLHALYRRRRLVAALALHFNRAYYYALERAVYDAKWLGTRAVKYPTDMWVYQELLVEQKPDLVVETGTYLGGSTLFIATILDALGKGEVISIDSALGEYGALPEHPRIRYLKGSSRDERIISEVRRSAAGRAVLVILDSEHSYDHVLGELRAYGPLVGPGGYLIVEDTNVNGHPVLPDWGPGPMEAVRAYLGECSDFIVDRRWEKFMLTSNPCGYLRRVASPS